MGQRELSDIVLEAERFSFTSHILSRVPTKNILEKAGENLYRQACFTVYAMGSGSDRTFNWFADSNNMTILLVPVADGFSRRFFCELSKPQEKPLNEDQVAHISW